VTAPASAAVLAAACTISVAAAVVVLAVFAVVVVVGIAEAPRESPLGTLPPRVQRTAIALALPHSVVVVAAALGIVIVIVAALWE